MNNWSCPFGSSVTLWRSHTLSYSVPSLIGRHPGPPRRLKTDRPPLRPLGGHLGALLLLVALARLLPREEAAELLADGLDLVVLLRLAELGVRGPSGLVLRDPLAGELAVLDLLQYLFHVLAGVLVDDHVALGEPAVLGGVGDRVPHAAAPVLVHQVDDEFELVEALEVRHLGGVARVDERLVALLHQRGDAAAEDGLLAEQVGLRLLAERRLDDAGAGTADGGRVREALLVGVAGRVLVDGQQSGGPLVVLVVTADEVAG